MKSREEYIEQWLKRDVSWSQINSWRYNKLQWANSYLFNTPFEPNALMIFGNVVGDTLGTEQSMVPDLEPHLKGEKEYKLHVKMNDRYLVGYCDHYDPMRKLLNENKTSVNPNRWDQQAVDDHGQLTMYSLMLYLQNKTLPEDLEIWLNFIPVAQKRYGVMHIPDPSIFHRFQTKRTLAQCLQFGGFIEATLKEMEIFANNISLPSA